MATNAKRLKLDSLIFIFVTVFVILLLLSHPAVGEAIIDLGQKAGLIGIFITGFFYTTSTTSPPAAVAAFFLGKVYSPFLIAGIGAFGSMCADFLLFKFFNHDLTKSADYLAKKLKLHVGTRKKLGALAPMLAFMIIASPLPDELGIAILGTTHIKTKMFFAISYLANFIGLLAVAWLGSVL